MQLCKRCIKAIIINMVYFLDTLYPKNKNIIAFFQANNRYSDNPRVLFDYLLNNKEFDVFWFYEGQSPGNDKFFIKRYSLQGLQLFLKAKFAVISHGDGDFGLYRKNNKFTIQVWHGTPIKNIGMYDPQYKPKKVYFDLFIVGSEIERHYISSAYGIPADNFLVSGLPRNDFLLSSNSMENGNTFLKRLSHKKVILYAPTFRDRGETVFFPFDDFDLSEITKFLFQHDAILLIRAHPNDTKSIQNLKQLSENSDGTVILAMDDAVDDINNLLPYVDVIVTDYSSIYIDLLLKDVPPIFIPYDLESYKKGRGLAYNYDLVTPGPKVSSQRDFLEALNHAFYQKSFNREHRDFVKKMFHKYDDGKACERIVERIKGLI